MVRFSEDAYGLAFKKSSLFVCMGLTVELCQEGRPLCKAKQKCLSLWEGRAEDAERDGWRRWKVEGRALGGRTGRGLGSGAPGNLSFKLQGQLSKIADSRMRCVLAPR